jgi:hypothetical protein
MAAVPASSFAQRRFDAAVDLSAAVLDPAPSPATGRFDVVGDLAGGVLTKNLCGPVTPAVLGLSVSVPPSGAGNVCTNDLQCAGAGEACVVPIGSTAGVCSASGHLARGDIHYVAGRLVDVDVTVPSCAGVSDVLYGGASLTGSGIDASSTPASWWRLSSVPTTVSGQAASVQRVRIQFPNFGDGQSASIQVKVTSSYDGASTISAPFTLASVAAVNGLMRTTVTEPRMRNEFVTSLYGRFGDYDQMFDEDGNRIYGLDWSELSAIALGKDVYFRGSDMRIGSGVVNFSTQFKADAPGCDPNVYVDGSFTLAPSSDGVDLLWVIGPRAETNASGACAILSLGIWDIVTDILADEDEIARLFAENILRGFDADASGHIQVCAGCRVSDVKIGDGRIEIWTVPPVERVRIAASAHDRADYTADPGRGVPLPAGLFAPIVPGGSIETCQANDGSGPPTCSPRFASDSHGLFNWHGNDVPVPSPIHCNQYGVCAVLGGRQNAWARLLGVTRNLATLPEKTFPAGSLIARRTASSAHDTPASAGVSNGCVMPPNGLAAYRIAFEVNDVATPVTGTPPSRGKLDATLFIAQDAAQSAVLFGSRPTCRAAPSQSPILATRGTLLAR